MSENSITAWLEGLQAGEERAGQELFEQYFEQLVRLARKKLDGSARREADEEDVALSAFKSFFLGVEHGRYPRLRDRGDLWRLLVTITEHKAIDQIRRQKSQKRGGGNVRGESIFLRGDDENQDGLAQIAAPDAEFAEQLTAQCRRLLEMLEEDDLRQVALLKMEGLETEEIAQKINRTVRTVQRRLKLIQDIWSEELS